MNPGIDTLIAKRLSGNANAEESTKLDAWIGESTDHQEYYLNAEKLWQAADRLKHTEAADVEAAWNDLQRRIAMPQKRPRVRKVVMWRYAAVIGGIAMLSMLIAYFMGGESPVKFSTQVAARMDTLQLTPPSSTKAAATPDTFVIHKPDIQPKKRRAWAPETLIAVSSQDSAMKFSLPDGTVVYLNKNSKLTYPEKFVAGSRSVYLSGEAYFEVSHNRGEFMVYCQDVRVRVLGTSFNVKGYEPVKQVEVMVVEGLVEVKAEDKPVIEPMLLKAGEQASYLTGRVTIVKSKASKRDRWWKRGGFRGRVKDYFNRILNKNKKH
jgi:transmembrane sensor